MNYNKLPTGTYIHLAEPKLEIENSLENGKLVANMMMKVKTKICDLKDKVLCDEIIEYAKEQGITDLFLIDEEFLKSALLHEIERREKPKTNFDKITSSVDVLLDFLDKHTDFCTVDRCKECHDFNTMGCRECIRQWLQEECEQ